MKSQFIRHANTNLYLLPSIHYAPEFLSMSLLSGVETFDILCLELPESWPLATIVDQISWIHPSLGLILTPCTPPVMMDVPQYPGSSDIVRCKARGAICLPIVTDSIVSLLRLAHSSSKGWRPDVYFVDASPQAGFMSERFQDSPDGTPLRSPDPFDVLENGLPAWFDKAQPYLTQVVHQDADFDYRNKVMAQHLRTIMNKYPSRRILFVCGASHATPVCQLLQQEPFLTEPPPRHSPAPQEIYAGSLSGDSAHLLGFCDLPCAMADFEQSSAQGQVEYRRQDSLDRMMQKSLASAGPHIPPRSVLNFSHLMEKMLRADGRRSLIFEDHIIPASECTIKSPTFSMKLWECAMQYKLQPFDSLMPKALVIPGLEPGLKFIRLGSQTFFIRQPVHPHRHTIRRTMYWRSGRGEGICKHQGVSSGASINPPAEERLLKWLCEEARSRAHQLQQASTRCSPKKFKGEFRGKPNWRKTVWSKTRGQSSLFLDRSGQAGRNKPCLDCAVVFILDAFLSHLHAPIADWWRDERPIIRRLIYANFIWFGDQAIRNGITEHRVAIRTRLYRKLLPTHSKEVTYRLLDELPRDKLCTCLPWNDSELQEFHDDPISLALTAAIKWTVGDHITVVATQPTTHVSPEVARFALERGIRLIHLSTYQFRDPLIFDRFSIDSEVPVRDPWTPPEPSIVCRCRSVPGFDNPS